MDVPAERAMLPEPLKLPLKVVIPELLMVSVVPALNVPVPLNVISLLPPSVESLLTIKEFVIGAIEGPAVSVPPLSVNVPVPNALPLVVRVCSVPAVNVVPPVNVLSVVNVNVPVPCLIKLAPVPEKMPVMPLRVPALLMVNEYAPPVILPKAISSALLVATKFAPKIVVPA